MQIRELFSTSIQFVRSKSTISYRECFASFLLENIEELGLQRKVTALVAKRFIVRCARQTCQGFCYDALCGKESLNKGMVMTLISRSFAVLLIVLATTFGALALTGCGGSSSASSASASASASAVASESASANENSTTSESASSEVSADSTEDSDSSDEQDNCYGDDLPAKKNS